MKPLPIPCPADQVPDTTGIAAFNAAYEAARTAGEVFVCVARRGPRWTVKLDALTALAWTVGEDIGRGTGVIAYSTAANARGRHVL